MDGGACPALGGGQHCGRAGGFGFGTPIELDQTKPTPGNFAILVREANDRGYECLVLTDCVGSYFPAFQQVGLEMVAAQGGIFGWTAPAAAFLAALATASAPALSTT